MGDHQVPAPLDHAGQVLAGLAHGNPLVLHGLVLSILDHVRRGYRPKNSLIAAREADGWRNAPIDSCAQFAPGLMAYHFSHSLYYANAELFSQQVHELVDKADPPVEWFCVDAVAIDGHRSEVDVLVVPSRDQHDVIEGSDRSGGGMRRGRFRVVVPGDAAVPGMAGAGQPAPSESAGVEGGPATG